jgi:4-amino-4-deoxy-L-arabinose transferase-like glycosyltransferase
MHTKKIIILVVSLLLLTLVIISFYVWKISPDVEKNFKQNENKFYEIADFLHNKYPINIRFLDKDRIDIIIWEQTREFGYKRILEEKNIHINNSKLQKILNDNSWVTADLKYLHKLLESINCSGIQTVYLDQESQQVLLIDYKRNILSLNLYVYFIFPKSLDKAVMESKTYEERIYYLSEKIGWSKIGPAWD